MCRIAVCMDYCTCTYSREILMVLNFYFAPSLNLIDIIRGKMHYVQQLLLYRICHTVHQSEWLIYTNFSLHVHEFGTMSVMIVFFFYFSFTYAPLFCRHLCYDIEMHQTYRTYILKYLQFIACRMLFR